MNEYKSEVNILENEKGMKSNLVGKNTLLIYCLYFDKSKSVKTLPLFWTG